MADRRPFSFLLTPTSLKGRALPPEGVKVTEEMVMAVL